MAKNFFSDEEVEREIERLNKSEAVALARREQSIRYRRRQHMYNLRTLEKRGIELMERGVTMDALELMDDESV